MHRKAAGGSRRIIALLLVLAVVAAWVAGPAATGRSDAAASLTPVTWGKLKQITASSTTPSPWIAWLAGMLMELAL